MKKCDIIHIISGDLWAGAEVQMFHTLVQLKKQGIKGVYAILFNNGILNLKLQENNIPTFVIDESRHNALIILIKLTSLLFKIRPRIIHVHAYKEHLLGKLSVILHGNNDSIVRTFHGITQVSKRGSLLRSIKSTIIYKIEKMFLNNKETNIIAVSKDLEIYLKKYYPKATITQIYNSIPVYDKRFVSKEDIRKRYRINDNVFWIGTVARLEKTKNLGLLIDAARELKAWGIKFRISIWGEGVLKNRIQREIDQNKLQKYIKLEGFEKCILPVINSLDIFTLCSLHEGLPMSLLEAMSLGVPVVCTKVGGMNEVIINNHSGLLVPSNNGVALAKAFLKLNRDNTLRKILANNGKKRITFDFDIKNTNKKLIQLYKNIINKQKV